MASVTNRLKRAWNAFSNNDTNNYTFAANIGPSSYVSPSRNQSYFHTDDAMTLQAIKNRIAMDAASIKIVHARLDDLNRYVSEIDSKLNNCLTLEANVDQSSRAFIQDVVYSMLDEGVIAIVPIDTTDNPKEGSFDIKTMRVGKIVEWFPKHVKIDVYNDRTGRHQDIIMPKESVAIVENPLYNVMNAPNSTLKRLSHKMSLLDFVDNQSCSGKLDLIIQVPYGINTTGKKVLANNRKQDIENQLTNSKYGIAYIDGTEKITQLNRPVENNLIKQVTDLRELLYSQIGITKEIMEGNADDKAMTNYYSRTIEPIVCAIVDAMKRTFLSKTARSQGQSICFFRNLFKLASLTEIAEAADRLTRNEILSSNEIRQEIGYAPDSNERSDELINKNIKPQNMPQEIQNEENENSYDDYEETDDPYTMDDYREDISVLDNLDQQLDDLQHGDTYYHFNYDNYLMHYASKYYDPVKAHEYYMKTRQLTGRKSTVGFNEKGRSAARYVRNTTNEAKREAIRNDRNETNQNIEGTRMLAKEQNIQFASDTNSKIRALKSSLRKMTKEEREEKRDDIDNQIAGLRDSIARQRLQIQSNVKELSGYFREEHRKKKGELSKKYDDDYYNELDALRKDKSMLLPPKSKKSKSKSKKSNKESSNKHGIIYFK